MKMTEARELAFKLLYSIEMQKEGSDEQVELFIETNEIQDENVKAYIKDIYDGVKDNKEEIYELIQKNLKQSWDLERISKINLAILKLGIYEMLHKNIPYKVVINETVELAKKFGEETSGNFVNGIFASIVKEKNLEQ